jgi:hypothetical protein
MVTRDHRFVIAASAKLAESGKTRPPILRPTRPEQLDRKAIRRRKNIAVAHDALTWRI